ncbi:asparagine synthase (glutamine-hydrolyzing) [Rubinisphaera margarita]|uniref:asparagine synthase (glutamine-hydrolyzing) n=1 Tax=Rubinisphaera margarita TaxID=2909586 RepID=UPI001EE84BB5|nr:asparagine synthase (glutamine-hydrolyzing) [Rubinisphaera margarita]MCG6154413.1 asparagine synthase (glutamine-hydrolyzing) [Rubinisphaera margarita]
MCGIAGFLTQPGTQTVEHLTSVAGEMADALQTRGPDDEGVWSDAAAGIALGHRRLSILDLSEQGHQPMLSACGRFVLVYNGEIYNSPAIRAELESEGARFRGHSDTEVLLAAISKWGLRETLPKLIGMFAFAVWNRHERRLTLVRDRIGIKPVYYGRVGNDFVFGSELKSIRRHPAFQNSIDPSAVALLMRHCYIPAPYSIFDGIRKLPPGCLLEIAIEDGADRVADIDQLEPVRYWDLHEVIRRGSTNGFSGSFDEAVERLDQLLRDAVELRMLADVPVGAFLSGGIDSSLVVAMMQRQRSLPVKTFTIGFDEHDYDEAPYAHRISEHLGTEHHELCITPKDARDVIAQLATVYDEPFADMSQIPTCIVSRLARRDVTVSLSGDGGDELFGGYNRYVHLDGLWDRLQHVPGRKTAASLLEKFGRYAPETFQPERLRKMAEVGKVGSPEELYAQLHRHWMPGEIMAAEVSDPSRTIGFGAPFDQLELPRLKWMALDTLTYLPDDILTKVDRASMQVSLEARVPLLDHRVVEFAWSLPAHYRYEGDNGKKILRAVLDRYVPSKLVDRPKVGFGIPIGDWLRGSLREWAEDLLSDSSLNEHGLLQNQVVRSTWEEHCSGRQNLQYPLWDILMFQQWYREWM